MAVREVRRCAGLVRAGLAADDAVVPCLPPRAATVRGETAAATTTSAKKAANRWFTRIGWKASGSFLGVLWATYRRLLGNGLAPDDQRPRDLVVPSLMA